MTEHIAAELARNFLATLARRDFAGAATLLAADFLMTVSGGHQFRSLSEFAAFSASRNGVVRKFVTDLDVSETAQGWVVYVYGSMAGQWLNGSSFDGVRYVDRFAIRDNRIVRLEVWSDMAEFRPPA